MARAVSLEIGLNAPMTGLHAGSSEIRHIYTPLSPVYCLQENPVVTFSLSWHAFSNISRSSRRLKPWHVAPEWLPCC
jgi:hypothetical protein